MEIFIFFKWPPQLQKKNENNQSSVLEENDKLFGESGDKN